MIMYSYECQDCGYQFQVEQSMSDKPLKKCPECSGRIDRLITGGAGAFVKKKMPSCPSADSPSPCSMRGKCGARPGMCGMQD